MSLLKQTEEFLESSDLDERKKKGQYFTPHSIKEAALSQIDLFDGARVLENSCGTGEFIHSIIQKNPNVCIDAYDIDPKMVSMCKSSFPGINAQTRNFLEMDHKPEYDYVIGNPPYFEYLERDMPESIVNKFKTWFDGKPNIYALFIKASIDCLVEGGKLVFVVPKSINNGFSFRKFREYIIKNCNILNMSFYKANMFKNAQQEVMILVLQKLKRGETNNKNYLFSKHGMNEGNVPIFTLYKDRLESEFNNSKSLKELGFKVKTGNFVWNQNKDIISRNKLDTKLLWSCNIVDNKLKLDLPKLNLSPVLPVEIDSCDVTDNTDCSGEKEEVAPDPLDLDCDGELTTYDCDGVFTADDCDDNDPSTVTDMDCDGPEKVYLRPKFQKGQYVSSTEKIKPLKGRAIILNRIVGTSNSSSLRAAIVDFGDEEYYVENHLNVITETDESKYTLEQIYDELIKPEKVEMLKMVTGNTQLSQRELENLIPINIEKRHDGRSSTNKLTIKFKKMHPHAVIPTYAKEGDAAMDLYAVEHMKDKHGNHVYFTGVALEIPEGFVGLLFPRSSVSKTSMSLANSVGVIDSGYRGEIMLKYRHVGGSNSIYVSEDRVGQLMIIPHPRIELIEVEELSSTERGKGGFGSTGS